MISFLFHILLTSGNMYMKQPELTRDTASSDVVSIVNRCIENDLNLFTIAIQPQL